MEPAEQSKPSDTLLPANYHCHCHCCVIQFFDSLEKECFFPSLPALFCPLSSAVCCCFRNFVFECPYLYWATKIFNFDPCKLFMISKHYLLKRLWAFVHSHLIPTLVCSVGTQETSFRICSTDLCVNWRMGENINAGYRRRFQSPYGRPNGC